MEPERMTVRRARHRLAGGVPILVIAGALLSTQQAAGAGASASAPSPRTTPARAGVVKPKPAPILVDINSASGATLKTLPGIGDAEAGRIVAGRPYLTKAELVTKNVLPVAIYAALKNDVIARQSAVRPPGAGTGR
jgi:DNA uptake protein ComE-like DNA-binding protein